MIRDEQTREAEAHRFFLGEMTERERAAFEEKFVADADFFEQTSVVEDELIESYARGTLSAADREKFERSFLTTNRRRERVEFARTMLEKLSRPKTIAAAKKNEAAASAGAPLWDSIKNFFKTPSLAFGAGLAVLLLAFGGWFLLRNPGKREIAEQIAPTPTMTTAPIQTNLNINAPPIQPDGANTNQKTPERIETNNSGRKNETPNKNSNSQNSNGQKEKPIRVNPVLALVAGTVRSEGKTQKLDLPENAGTVSLQLKLESTDYKIYLAEIVDADGSPVARSGKLKARNSNINFSVPAAKLRHGDYIVKLSALNPQNETESVADYTFRVNRK